MAVNPQALKLLSLLVPGGVSPLTQRAVARGLTRDNPVPLGDLVELIAKRTGRKYPRRGSGRDGIRRDPNFKKTREKGVRYKLGENDQIALGPSTGLTAEEIRSLSPKQRSELFEKASKTSETFPFSNYTTSAEDYLKLRELQRVIRELFEQ